MKTDTEAIPVSFAGFTKPKIPSWAARWKPRRTTLDELYQQGSFAGILVVSTPGTRDVELDRVWIDTLAEYMLNASDPVWLVLNFKKGGHTSDQLFEVFKPFRGVTSRLEVADGEMLLENSFNEAMAKYRVENEERGSDPLAEAREVIEATEALRSEKGRLSAKAVADAIGIPLSRLAVLLGSTKQAVSKTPDSIALQAPLRTYERILRLRSVLTSKAFLTWMNRQNMHLDDQTPLQIIASGRANVVADLVESMLTGTSS